MLSVRKSAERGHADHGWLKTYHTFSFAQYFDPRYRGISHLRVINEDRVMPGAGFAPHSHRDMEIVSYVLEGALAHRDSMGNSSVIGPGEVQRMSAGTGITHSEYNASATEPVHFLQIWILPNRNALEPGYEQKRFADEDKRNRWRLVVSPDGRQGSLTVHQDAYLYATLLEGGEAAGYRLEAGRIAYVQVARGEAAVNGRLLEAGDGAALSDEAALEVRAAAGTEVLLFDLPA